MDHSYCNCSNKIWIIWTVEMDITIFQDKKQHVLIKATHLNNQPIFLTIVYAKCTKNHRRELCNDLKEMANNIQGI
ncbi:hypothetical protein H5410_055953 [Solanum commersonii]|uniref:Uncharacterized protein n=1 Tax=Solanum commersonii TaxID=4109 RepID=A0A9J5WIY6_SOLCO|nr:hypothetical protein H5410_055953 [Solanum commersonii]